MSLGAGSPSPSSGSDDFAALLDAEMIGDRSSITPERSGGEDFTVEEAGGVESSAGEEEEEEEVEEEEVEEDEEDEDEEVEEEEEDRIEGEDDIEQANPIEIDDDLQLQELSRKRRRGEDDEPAGASGVAASEKCPPHPGFMWGVCIRCGEKRSTIPTNDPIKASVALRYIHEGLEVSTEEAHRMRCDELRRVTSKQKLLLVVDLDHTMLNSARFLEVPQEEEAYLAAAYLGPNAAASSAGELQGGASSLHQLTRLQMWTKLRPYAHGFLEEASKLYEMYVYTMGEKIYALAMAQLLDPTGRLFGDRIISQLDSTKRNTKDLDVVLGAESAVVILDDTEMVWPNHKANLILMERYHFFSSSSRQFGVGSPSLAQMHRDESGSDGTLATTLKVLRAIHHGYFHKPLDQKLKRRSDVSNVQEVIRKIRAKVLADCNIVFSRIFPVGHPSPEYHPFWQLAVSLGAKCSTSYDTITTTHVVALDRGTDKARTAKLEGKFLVHPSWVEAARYLWCRPHEKDYPVTDDTSKSPVTMFVKSVPIEPRQQANVEGGNGETQTQGEQSAAEVDVLTMNTSEVEIAVSRISSQAVHLNGPKLLATKRHDCTAESLE